MKKHDGLLALLILLFCQALISSNAIKIASEYEFSQQHYNATVFKFKNTPVQPQRTLISLKTDKAVSFRVADDNFVNFFVPWSEHVAGVTFLRLRTTNLAASSRNFTGTLAVPISAEIAGVPTVSPRCILYLKVLAVTELCPFISAISYTFSIDSTQSLFSTIGHVQVEVPSGGETSYVLYLRDLSPVFTLNPHTGALVLTSRPLQKEYKLRAIVVNPKTRSCPITENYSDVLVTVIVKDLDRVSVQQITGTVNVLNHVNNLGKAGSVFAWLNLTGASNRSSVQILNSEANNYFEFVHTSDSAYRLQLRNDFSFSPSVSQRQFNVNFSVTDPVDQGQHFTGNFIVNPNDRSLLGIDPTNLEFFVSVPECMPVGSIIFQFHSTIYNQTLPHIKYRYNMLQGNSYVHLDEDTGVLVIKSPLDAESAPKLSIFARIRDADNLRRLIFHTLTVDVTDCNEFAPSIANNATVHSVSESATVGTMVLTVDADDADATPSDLIVSMAESPEVPFGIVGKRIVVSRSLDSETMAANYTLYVRVSDQGQPIPRESLAIYYVNINPEDEFRPEFESDSCVVDLLRSDKSFETGHFPALDLDYPFAPVTYKIVDDPLGGRCFTISSTTGNLKLVCDLNGVINDQIVLSIVATDRAGRESPKLRVRFNILDNLQFSTKRTRCVQHVRSVTELYEANKKARNSHEVSVQMFESLQSRSFGDHLPNRPPLLNSVLSSFSVPENIGIGQTVASFFAEDQDPYGSYNGRLQFRIDSGNIGYAFNVTQRLDKFSTDETDDSEGSRRVSLVVLNELDREKRETYMLNITVCDMGEPSYCSTLSHVMIRVLDVNDNSPLLESPVFDVTVPEDTPIGTEICRFSATDPDAGSNGTVRYSVSDTNAFSINSNTGVLRTASRDLLDRESVSVYDLLVRAHDSGQPERSSELHFRVNIADENDHAPTFITKSPGPSSSERLALTISEDIPVNSFLTRLIAVDSDYGENGRIVYSLSGVPKVLSHFVIDQDSGCLYLAKPLSAALSPYQLFVDARDSAIAPKRSRISLNINVVAAVPPPVYIIFSEAVYSFSLSEDVRVGTSVGRINTTIYPNVAASSSITVGYVITSGSGLGRFTIDQTGEIRTRIPLDRESQPAGLWLTVHAYLLAGQTVVTHAEEKISICQVYINLEDVNDYRPMPTEQTHYRLQLVEAAPAGTVLLSSIPAMDQDLGDNASIVYAITDGNTAGHFRIDPETGRLTTTELAVDREVADQFLLTVSLADRGAPPLSTDLLVEIAVSDLNDSPPKFVRPLFQVTAIADSSAEGTSNDDEQVLLTRLPAVDKDLLENATILYSLQPSGSGVRISKSTGELSISRRLLRLDTGVGSNMMTFTVVAKDAGRLELSAMASVKLTIEQQQPTLPEPDAGTAIDLFQIDVSGEDGADAVVRLFDNLALEDSVPRLLVTPAVTMATKMLFTLTGRGSEDFYMPQSGGRLQLIRRLSHARQAVYNLTVGARLSARLQTKSLLLLVSQSNRNSPMFSKPVYDTSVTEGANLQLLQVFATDPDPGPTGHLQYSLVSAAQSASLDHFSLEPLTGRLAAMPPPSPPLNHESAGIHELLVRAVDSYSTDRRFSLARVIVTVTNENEHYPVVVTARPSLPDLPAGASIAQRQYQAEALNKMSRSPQEPALLSASVLANARPGYPLLQVYAFDLDSGRSGQLAYSVISGNDLGLFDLDSETGQLSTGKLLVDFAGHNLSLSLAVSDLGSPPKASLCLVSIRIINHEPNRPVVFGQHHYNVKIVEEAPPGSFVIKVDAKANDMPLVYSITSGNELGLFDIAPSTGVLIVKNPVDRETHGDFFRLGVQVQAVDTRLAVLTEVLVNVLDVNDNRPAFLSDRLADGVVSEDAQRGQIVREAGRPRPLTIKAADADFGVNQELTYEIADPAADAAFSVDPVTGAIRVSQPLDRETRDLYEFDVWVRDSGTPKRLRSAKPARVRIRILDVNDCPPQYSRADYYTVLELPSYDGARLARIRAYDRDLNNSVSLSIVSGNADGLFQLHPVSGLLTLARPELLREHYYFLVISATDSVHVSLTNISINARQRTANLQLLPANLTVHVQENSAEVTTLAKFRPYPAPLNYPYRFSLISPSEYFSVNSITGVLATTGRPMDAEQARRHVLLVRATAESKLGFAQVTVQVDDTNDNRPVFVNRPYNSIMFAGQPLGSVALIARAIDADSGANGLVRYELRNHHSEFWINATGGQVYTRKIIEQPAVFTLELRAIDAGSPIQQFSTVAATVQVVANNTPVFPNGSVTVSVSESLRPNSEIFTVQAEAPGSATLIYTIESGNVGEMFSLDFQTGVVKTTDKLDYETIPHYQLTVRVTEPSLKTFTDMQLVINVTDVNDERPEFTASSFDVTVSEHEDPQRKVLLTASATDRDSGAGGEVTYSIEELADGSSDGASFSVDPTSGQLRLSLRLDYETKRQHQFWIVAADRGSPSQSARVPVTIRVADYNDCSPKFRLQTYNVSIAEQSRPGTFVAKVTAVDPDESSELTYSLESSFDAYQFRIDPEYGTIRYQPIQTSLGRTFRLAVLVTDSVHSDRAIVLVNLLPGPAGPPRCAEPLFHAKVLENSLPGSLLDQAQVRTIGGAELVYQSFSDKINRLLDIDRRTGRISTRVSLDREGPDPIRTLDFAVLASGSGGLHATCSVVISVLNENDNPPVFDPQPTEIVLTEDAPVGTVAFRLRATDLDDPNRPIDNYRLLNESPLFAVNTTSGLVTLKRSFASYTASMAVDRADLRLHQLTVSARDWEPPYHQTRLDLAVRFAPGPLPEFRLVCSGMASASDDLRLSENSPAGTRLVSCRAQINGSFTSAYQASLAFGESDVRLLIAGDNLTVVSSRPYDRERESAIRFALSARSAGTRPTLPTFRAFRLDILNQPDMPPAFETAEYNLEVSEAAPVGSTLLQARAVDPDGDFPLTYQLLPASGGGGGGGNDSGSASPLRIGQQSGLVTVAAPLDRDSPLATPRAYRLLATDSSGMTGEARLVISLVDVNDEPLTWPTEDASDSTMLSEDAPVDTEVARLSIRDRDDTDRPPVRFYFASRPPAEFDLTEDGRLMLSGQLDRERQDAYEFDILATDGVFTTERAWRQRVLVRDVNDNAPVCRQPLQKLKLSEGLAVGYAVATVVATDADTQEKGLGLLEYFIVYSGNNSAEAAGLFSVDRHSGLVILAAKLDRETADWHSVTVLASDGKFNCSSTLEIQVLDENDCEPEFTARSLPPVPEDIPQGSVIGKVHAEDCDTGENRRIVYSIQPNVPEAAYFRIDPKSGIISVDFQKLDRETTPVHRIPVIATDSGVPQLSTTQTVSLTLMDVNDNPPEFVRSSLDFSLSESTPVGYEITRLNATSKDDGNNAVIRYQLMDHDNYFSLSATEGTLTVKSALDYERQQVYYLTVKAYDLGEPPLSATAVVTVKVIDENDNAPEFPADGFRVSVKENEPPGTPLSVKVLANDADSGENGRLTYKILDGDPDRMFALDTNSGQLVVRTSPDRELKDSYTLTVMATDHGSTPFSASTTVKITVLDVNDCVPQFDRAEYAFVLQIDDRGNVSQQPYMDTGSFLPPDGNLIGVTDCDAPPNGAPFSWSILDGSPRYSISRGRVRAKPGGGYVTGTEKIRVQVCDSGDIIRCNHTTVSIRIVKADSVPPKILAVNMTSNFYYRLQPTVHIGNVQLLHHKPADVQLTLLTHDDLFRLTRQGSIVTRESLPHGTYRLRVRAAYNGLESEQDISVRVNLITDKMIANAAVLRISNESAYAFFYNRLDASLVDYFSSTLGLPVDNVYIVTVQQQDQQLRVRRSADAAADATSPPVARNQPLLVMLSVYDSRAGAYISPAALQRLKLDGLSEKLGRPVAFLTDCPTNPCLNGGRCHLVPEPLPGNDLRVVTAHASFLSPRVRLAPYCACTDGFAGRTCQMSLAACNCRPDQRCHHLPTGHYICLEQDAGANARACADDSGADCASNATVVHLRGAGNLAWSLNESSPASTASGDPAGRSFAVDLEFRMRSLQNQPGPVFAVHWTPNAPQLRDIVISLGQDGALQVAPAVNGRVQPRPWAASRRRVNDGRWHGVRLRLMREAESRVARSEQALRNWTIELLVDSIEPTLRAIPWSDAPTQKRVSTGRAYVGCLGQMRLNGLPLPVSERQQQQQQQQAQPGNLPRVSLTSGTEGATTGCSNTYFGTACAVAPCQHAGVCSNTPGGYQCQCASPYIGRQCEINTEPCAESPCLNGATCHQSGRHFTCECPAGLSGSRCEFGIYCGRDVNPCENNARCEESPSGAICHCGGTGYQGPTCGVDVDECSGGGAPAGGGGARSPCGGRGVCVNQPGSYYCNCSLGYSGRSCETFHVPGVDSGSSALLGLSFHEVVAILSSISIILLLALTIFFVVSYCSRRRGGSSGGGVRRRHGKDRHASSSAAAAAAAAAKSGSTLGSGTYRQCSNHDPAEAMALVTLATGETCMVPQRQLDLRHSVPNCYSSEHNLPEAAAVAASYAAYDKPHPPRPFSFYSDTAGTPTRCLTPSCTATISRRPNQQQQQQQPHHGHHHHQQHHLQPAFLHSRGSRLYARQGAGSALGDIIDEQEVHHFGGVGGSVSPAGSHASRQGYHWDTSDWNTGPGNPPDLIPDSPYCLYAPSAAAAAGASQASSLAGSPAHSHSGRCQHQLQQQYYQQQQQQHQMLRPTPVHGGRMMQQHMVMMGSSESLGAGSNCSGSYSGSVGPRRPSLQRMLLANPGAYLPQYAGSACDFDEAREDLEEADEEESSRAALLPGSGGGGANSDQMTTSTSTFRGGGGGSSIGGGGTATASTKTGGSGSTEIGSGGSATPIMEERPPLPSTYVAATAPAASSAASSGVSEKTPPVQVQVEKRQPANETLA